MTENKKTRRSSQQVWEDKIKAQEDKVNSIQTLLNKAKQELEDLKNNPPSPTSRASESTLITKISKHPEHLKELSKILSVEDEQNRKTLLKELLTKIETQDTKAS